MDAKLKKKSAIILKKNLSFVTLSFYININQETMKTDLKKVFFRLNSPYEWGKGMSEDLSEPFNLEAMTILEELGFDIANDGSNSFSCPEGVQGEQNLYMHPMDFSGILSNENFLKAKEIIERAAEESSIFSVRAIDIFDLEEYHMQYIESNLRKQKLLDEKK
jgi:hypothetical protein